MAAPMWVQVECQPFLLFLILSFELLVHGQERDVEVEEDLLLAYSLGHHGPRHRLHRHIRAIQPPSYGNYTAELYPAHESTKVQTPIVQSVKFVEKVGSYWESRNAYGSYYIVNNPQRTLSVLEPSQAGSCKKKTRAKVEDTAQTNNCLLATNAGFFNTTDGACLGDIVSDGHLVQQVNNLNAHFGIKKSGALFFGYLPETVDIEAEFDQLMTGVVWLIRDGRNYVDISRKVEASDTQETGSLDYFIDVHSARSAVGCDKEGRVIIAHVEGKTGDRGVSLVEFADLLLARGVVNAINLDGGGSSTSVVNGTLTNYPSDVCTSNSTNPVRYQCARKVSTALCVHEPHCDPIDCHNHGDCILGNCHCHANWAGPKCDQLECGPTNCSGHGICTETRCLCYAGWLGETCELGCPHDRYGIDCSSTCRCHNEATCLPIDGTCLCPPGYTGQLCDQECPYGYYGMDCRYMCDCRDDCTCHHITGQCGMTSGHSSLWQAAQCLADELIKSHHLVPDQPQQYRLWLISIISLTIIAAGSLILNISLICISWSCSCAANRASSYKHVRKTYQPKIFIGSDTSSEGSDSYMKEDHEMISLQELSKSVTEPNLGYRSKQYHQSSQYKPSTSSS